jgi:hypothetical protein
MSIIVESYLGWQNDGIMHAQKRDVPVVLSEYNSVACGGSNISSTVCRNIRALILCSCYTVCHIIMVN